MIAIATAVMEVIKIDDKFSKKAGLLNKMMSNTPPCSSPISILSLMQDAIELISPLSSLSTCFCSIVVRDKKVTEYK